MPNAKILRFPFRLRLVTRLLCNSNIPTDNPVSLRSGILTERVKALTLRKDAPFPLKKKEAIINSNLSRQMLL